MSQQPATSMFLRGPFAPVGREIDAVELQVDGQIPRDLNGTLFRAGPNPQFEPLIPSAHHWFDGDGMVHALTLQEGRASYRNRWVHTAAFLAERRRGTAAYGSFMNGGTPAPRMTGFPPLKNPGNTNVTVFDGRLLVFCEGDLPHSLGVDTLETHGQYDFHGDVSGVITAHFKIDPRNGDMLFFGAMGPSITWYRASNDGRLLESHAFLTGVPCFIHDFAVTEGYAIFFINPSIVDIEGVFEGRPSTIWNPEIRNRIAVMSRDTGKVQWIEQDETFAPSHFLNAHQSGRKIIVDANRAPTFGNRIGQRNPFEVALPWRWEIDLDKESVTSKQMADFNSEFPRHNESFTGRKHRFAYYAATRTGRFCENWLFDHVAKHDLDTGNVEYQNVGAELTSPGEPLFVPRANGKAEDDGWVLSMWRDESRDCSEIVVQAAQDFAARPVARIKLNQRVPMGFHGNWVSAG